MLRSTKSGKGERASLLKVKGKDTMAKWVSLVFFLFIVWVIVQANSGASSVWFELIGAIPCGDKVGHLGLFGVLTWLAINASKLQTFSVGRLSLYKGAVLVFTFVLVEEFSQLFIPTRTFDWMDLVMDLSGISLAALLASKLNKAHSSKLKEAIE